MYKIDRKRSYQAWSAGQKRSLGCFATAEEAALAHARSARSADKARRADEGGVLVGPRPKAAAAAQQGASAAATGAAGAAAAPTAASGGTSGVSLGVSLGGGSGSAWGAKRRGRSAAPEGQLAEAAAEPEAKRRCVSVSAAAPRSQPSAATDAKRRRRATGDELVSPLPALAEPLSTPLQSGQRHATDAGSQEV